MRTTILFLLLSAVAISADLLSDLDDIANHLPMEQLEAIGQDQLALDPNFRPAIANLVSLSDEEIYQQYISPELIDYFNRRGIDGESLFLHSIKMIKAYYALLLEKEPSGHESSGSVITLADLYKLIAASDAMPVIHQKLETSPEFANFVAAVRDPEFKAVLYGKINSGIAAGACAGCKDVQMRSWFSNAWKKIKKHGFGVGVSIPFGK